MKVKEIRELASQNLTIKKGLEMFLKEKGEHFIYRIIDIYSMAHFTSNINEVIIKYKFNNKIFKKEYTWENK